MYNLDRFIIKQKEEFSLAINEIKNGKKESHYIWYIFPQLKELGKSSTSKYYGISDLEEAKSYLENEFLRNNLINITKELLKIDKDILDIFPYPDNLKVKSSMTLFYMVDPSIKVFKEVIDKFYNGEFDNNTISLLKK